jgi:hypothetical protein
MKEHLSEEQISRWIAGDRLPDTEQHLQECMQCASEVAQMKKALAAFHDCVIEWSSNRNDAEAPAWLIPSDGQPRTNHKPLLLKLAAAALSISLAFLMFQNYNKKRAMRAYEADVKLLEEVNSHIAQPVPASLKPLVQLVQWETIDIEQ